MFSYSDLLVLLSIALNPLLYRMGYLFFILNILLQILLVVVEKETFSTKIWKIYILSFMYFGVKVFGIKLYDLVMFAIIIFLFSNRVVLKVTYLEMTKILLFVSYIIIVWLINGYYVEGAVEISRYILSIILFVLFANIKPNLKSVMMFILFLVIGNIIQSVVLYGLIVNNEVSHFTSSVISIDFFNDLRETRLSGFFTDPNKFLCFLFFLFVVYEYFYSNIKAFVTKKERFFAHVILYTGMLITFSRTALLSLAVYLFLLIYQKFFQGNKMVFIVAIIVVMIFVAIDARNNYKIMNFLLVKSTEILGRQRTLEINSNIMEENRYLIFKEALRCIKDKALIGYGPYSYSRLLPYPPHNTFITLMMDYGVIGLLIFLVLVSPLSKIKISLLIPFILVPSLLFDLNNFRLYYILLAVVSSKHGICNKEVDGFNWKVQECIIANGSELDE